MNKTLTAVAVLGATTVLSICELCVPGATPAARSTGLVRAAYAATAPGSITQAPTTKTVTLKVVGMTCGGCVLGTRTVLTRLPGVSKADVSYERGTAVVTYDPARVTVAQMIAAIKTLRYTATAVAG